jgi:hypothetical protein
MHSGIQSKKVFAIIPLALVTINCKQKTIKTLTKHRISTNKKRLFKYIASAFASYSCESSSGDIYLTEAYSAFADAKKFETSVV